MYIRHNISAINTIRQLSLANKNVSKHTERLSNSLRINRSGDDVAGFSISEKMRAQISRLSRASTNTQDSISLIQTAEGALAEVHNMLIRGRELSVQAANDTNTNDDRNKLQQELDQLLQEINHIGNNTEFNTKKLLDGTADKFIFQLGANSSQNIEFSIGKISSNNDLAIADLNIESQSNANDAIAMLDKAVKKYQIREPI